jgi:hypothetical protein
VSLPARFVGAWERTELAVDGAVVGDAGRVVWVEAGVAYVDVRGPGGFAGATTFGGVASWDEPFLTWAHDVDADAESGGVDRGRISFVDGDLVEEGEVDGDPVVRYREVWTPLPVGVGPVLVARTDGGIAVRVGAHASVVADARVTGGAVAARYLRDDGSAWSVELEHGAPSDLHALPGPLVAGRDLPPGWLRV